MPTFPGGLSCFALQDGQSATYAAPHEQWPSFATKRNGQAVEAACQEALRTVAHDEQTIGITVSIGYGATTRVLRPPTAGVGIDQLKQVRVQFLLGPPARFPCLVRGALPAVEIGSRTDDRQAHACWCDRPGVGCPAAWPGPRLLRWPGIRPRLRHNVLPDSVFFRSRHGSLFRRRAFWAGDLFVGPCWRAGVAAVTERVDS